MMEEIKIEMEKDKTTKGAYRFSGDYKGTTKTLYFRKTDISADINKIVLTVNEA